jgi:hypothetical protein
VVGVGTAVADDPQDFSFAGLAAFAELFLKRKLSVPLIEVRTRLATREAPSVTSLNKA